MGRSPDSRGPPARKAWPSLQIRLVLARPALPDQNRGLGELSSGCLAQTRNSKLLLRAPPQSFLSSMFSTLGEAFVGSD